MPLINFSFHASFIYRLRPIFWYSIFVLQFVDVEAYHCYNLFDIDNKWTACYARNDLTLTLPYLTLLNNGFTGVKHFPVFCAIKTLEFVKEKPNNEIYYRYVIDICKQRSGQSLDEFMQKMKSLARNCKAVSAEIHTDYAIRDVFISGLKLPGIRQRVVEDDIFRVLLVRLVH